MVLVLHSLEKLPALFCLNFRIYACKKLYKYQSFLSLTNTGIKKVRLHLSYALNSLSSILPSALYTPDYAPYMLFVHSAIYIFHSIHYSVHSAFYIVHSILSTLHKTLSTIHSTLFTLPSTIYTLHCIFFTQHSTFSTIYPQ